MFKRNQKYKEQDADQAFIKALGEVMSEEMPELPAEYSDRIDSALEREFQAAITNDAPTAHEGTSRWKLWILAIGGAAAVAASIWIAISIVFAPIRETDAPQQLAGINNTNLGPGQQEIPEVISEESLLAEDSQDSNSEEASAKYAYAGIANRMQSTPKHSEDCVDELDDADDDTFVYDDVYLSEEEEARLAANNYRVVTSEEEANAIICSVFGRMESNIVEENYRISEAIDDYESEIHNIFE